MTAGFGSFEIGSRVPAKPFIKWVGGKRKLLPELLKSVPTVFGTYYEPFLGGGALFFALNRERAVLSDTNWDLIRAYTYVRDNVEALIKALLCLERSKETYLELRAKDPSQLSDGAAAVRFIYLLKCGFNGIWRVNKSGKYNVPFGENKGEICDAPALRAASRALQRVTIRCDEFDNTVEVSEISRARRGDLVYFDPPYVPLTATSNFTSYSAAGFGDAEQVRLRDCARRLKDKGVYVLLSNSAAPRVRELYASSDFKIREVLAPRSVSCKGDKRGKITELLIT